MATLLLALFSAALLVSTTRVDARAFFVFGDSLVDVGNNNYLATTARADAPPYGIDYPTRRATGRFSNGYNIPDLISWVCLDDYSMYIHVAKINYDWWYIGNAGQSIGQSESPLPYLSPALNGARLLNGANFASAGVGVLNDTGVQFVSTLIWFSLTCLKLAN